MKKYRNKKIDKNDIIHKDLINNAIKSVAQAKQKAAYFVVFCIALFIQFFKQNGSDRWDDI